MFLGFYWLGYYQVALIYHQLLILTLPTVGEENEVEEDDEE